MRKLKSRLLGIALSIVIATTSFAMIPVKTANAQDNSFVAYGYCPCVKCCGKSDGITYSGVKAMEGRTIAVDKNVIPLGSTILVYINGELYGIYIAEDTGVKGNTLDIFFSDHNSAKNFGIKECEIIIVDAKG